MVALMRDDAGLNCRWNPYIKSGSSPSREVIE